jgi:hypothetical protein
LNADRAPQLKAGVGPIHVMMQKANLIAISLIVVACTTLAQAQSSAIYGAYRDCMFACRTILINADHTFVYRLDGDLFNGETHNGTWQLIGKNLLKASSPEDRTAPTVTERTTKGRDDFLVTVIDANQATLKGAFVSGVAGDPSFKIETNDSGVARIPRCSRFEIVFNGYRGVHVVANAQANEFVVSLAYEQMANWVINQNWLIEGRRLYVALDDGSFDKRYWLDKLTEKETRKIFH